MLKQQTVAPTTGSQEETNHTKECALQHKFKTKIRLKKRSDVIVYIRFDLDAACETGLGKKLGRGRNSGLV